MKKCLLVLLLLALSACAQKTATPTDAQGHGHGHGHAATQAKRSSGVPEHFPATPQQNPSLNGRVYTLSSYYAKTYEDLRVISSAVKSKDTAALQAMVSTGSAFVAPKASSVVIEDAFTPAGDLPVVKFRFLQESGEGFTYKSYLYEFQPDSM